MQLSHLCLLVSGSHVKNHACIVQLRLNRPAHKLHRCARPSCLNASKVVDHSSFPGYGLHAKTMLQGYMMAASHHVPSTGSACMLDRNPVERSEVFHPGSDTLHVGSQLCRSRVEALSGSDAYLLMITCSVHGHILARAGTSLFASE